MWKRCRNLYEKHLDYLQTYVHNPCKYSMIDYNKQIRTLFKYNKYPQPPSMHVQLALGDKWGKRNRVVYEKLIRNSIRYGLYETMQDKIDLKDDNYFMVSNNILNEYFDTIDHINICRRETHKRGQDKLKSPSSYNDKSHSSDGIIPKKASKEVKKTSQVKAILCSLQKRDMGFHTPSTSPTLTAPSMLWSTQRRILVSALLTATMSL